MSLEPQSSLPISLKIKNDRREEKLILPTRQFLQNAPRYYLTQPGLNSAYWFSKSERNTESIGILPNNQDIDLTRDLTESDIWIEGHPEETPIKLKGIHEGNIWDYAHNKWDQGNTLRITSGTLLTALLTNLHALCNAGALTGLRIVTYDIESNGSQHEHLDSYGALKPPNKDGSEKTSRGTKFRVFRRLVVSDSVESVESRSESVKSNPNKVKVKRKKERSDASFHWLPSCVRKFTYTGYYPNEHCVHHTAVEGLPEISTRRSLLNARLSNRVRFKRAKMPLAQTSPGEGEKSSTLNFKHALHKKAHSPVRLVKASPQVELSELVHLMKEGVIDINRTQESIQDVDLDEFEGKKQYGIDSVSSKFINFADDRTIKISLTRPSQAENMLHVFAASFKQRVSKDLTTDPDLMELIKKVISSSALSTNVLQTKTNARGGHMSSRTLLTENTRKIDKAYRIKIASNSKDGIPVNSPSDELTGCEQIQDLVQPSNLKAYQVKTPASHGIGNIYLVKGSPEPLEEEAVKMKPADERIPLRRTSSSTEALQGSFIDFAMINQEEVVKKERPKTETADVSNLVRAEMKKLWDEAKLSNAAKEGDLNQEPTGDKWRLHHKPVLSNRSLSSRDSKKLAGASSAYEISKSRIQRRELCSLEHLRKKEKSSELPSPKKKFALLSFMNYSKSLHKKGEESGKDLTTSPELKSLSTETFWHRCPYNFQDQLLQAMTKFMLTKETVTSIKGYSITSLTITRLNQP